MNGSSQQFSALFEHMKFGVPALLRECGESSDQNLFLNLNEALRRIRYTRKWDDSEAVFAAFVRRAEELAPVFAQAPLRARRQVLYTLLCLHTLHAEAWLYRADVQEREADGEAATRGWMPANYDLARDCCEQSAVSAAVMGRASLWALEAIVARGEPVNGLDRLGRTALHHAVEASVDDDDDPAPDVVNLLIDAGAEVGAHDASGLTALDLAVAHDRHRLIRTLVLAGAVPTSVEQRMCVDRSAEDLGWTQGLALHQARWREVAE